MNEQKLLEIVKSKQKKAREKLKRRAARGPGFSLYAQNKLLKAKDKATAKAEAAAEAEEKA